MDAVILAVQPEGVRLIFGGKRTMDPRKTRPNLKTPFKVYIYQTKKPEWVMLSGTGPHISEYDKTYCYTERSGKIVGEFICDYITDLSEGLQAYKELCEKSGVGVSGIVEYFGCKENIGGYGWHISELIIYKKPIELQRMSKHGYLGMGYSTLVCARCDCKYWVDSGSWDVPPDCAKYPSSNCTCHTPPQSFYYVDELVGNPNDPDLQE